MAGFNKQDAILSKGGSPVQNISANKDTPALNFMDDGNQYVLDCLTDLEAITEIADEWKALERQSAEPYTYFQSHDWCYHWCKTFAQSDNDGPKPKIRIYALRRNTNLIMIWPMMIVKSQSGQQNLTFLTEPHGQYSNIICDRKKLTVDVGKIAWRHICKTKDADAITLDQYPKSSMLKLILEDKGYVEKSEKFSSVLDLNSFDTWEDYRASLGRKTRKQRNQRYNKLTKQGEVEYQIYYGGSNEYREFVALALQWKLEWLAETGRRATVLSSDTTRHFLANLDGVPASSQDKIVQDAHGAVLAVLKVDDNPIGIEIGMCLDGHYYCYLGAFDWQYRNMSPGKIQMELSQKWAKEAGLRKFDFLGEPADYKASWSNTEDQLESRSVPLTLRGYIYCAIWKAHLRPWARDIFNKMDSGKRIKLLQLFGLGKAQSGSKPTNKAAHDNSADKRQGSPTSQIQ